MSRQARLVRVLQYQFKAALKENHPNLIPLVAKENLQVWHFLVVGLPHPFAGGEYIFELTALDDYPRTPPEFRFLTKNGVFAPGGKICISIGEFHANDKAGKTGAYGWRRGLGMIGFAREVVNGMLDPDHLGGGIRVRNDPAVVKATMAHKSVASNARERPELVRRFRAFENDHPNLEAVRARRMWAAAGAALATNLRALSVAKVAAVLAPAFGPDWRHLAPRFDARPSGEPLTPARLDPLVDQIFEALAEREPAIRRVLVLALRVRLCARGGGPAAPPRDAAWRDFMEALPGVCGGACRELVPQAIASLAPGPFFDDLHGELVRFLRTRDIDEKAQQGRDLAARAESLCDAGADAKPACDAGADAKPLCDADDVSAYIRALLGGDP